MYTAGCVHCLRLRIQQLQRSYESQEKEKMDREEVQTHTECANEQATAVRSVLSPTEDLPGTL